MRGDRDVKIGPVGARLPAMATSPSATLPDEPRAAWRTAKVGAIAGLLAGVIGAGAAICGTLITGQQSRSQAHDQFVTEQRRQSYAQYLAEISELSAKTYHYIETVLSAGRNSDSAVAELSAGLDDIWVVYEQLQLIAGEK